MIYYYNTTVSICGIFLYNAYSFTTSSFNIKIFIFLTLITTPSYLITFEPITKSFLRLLHTLIITDLVILAIFNFISISPIILYFSLTPMMNIVFSYLSH